ncbi:MAG: MarR family transcriptional regulator [Polyangiales bacterium]
MKLSANGHVFSEILIEVFRLNGLALAAGDRLTKPLALTSARWQVMGVIDHAPAPVAHVARLMGLTRQSVRETADALARAGFVSFSDNPHHRTARLLTLTDEGRRALRSVEQEHAAWASRLGRSFEPSELTAGLAALRGIREALEHAAASSGGAVAKKGKRKGRP